MTASYYSMSFHGAGHLSVVAGHYYTPFHSTKYVYNRFIIQYSDDSTLERELERQLMYSSIQADVREQISATISQLLFSPWSFSVYIRIIPYIKNEGSIHHSIKFN